MRKYIKKVPKVKPRRGKVEVAEPPQKIDLSRYVDFADEGEKFNLPTERVAEIAREVSAEPIFEVSVVKTESELRERLEHIYNVEAEKFHLCPYNGCREEFTEIYQFIAHQRMHLATESPDHRVRVAVVRDIERILVPIVEKSMGVSGALPPEERARLAHLLEPKGLLPTSVDRGGGEQQSKGKRPKGKV